MLWTIAVILLILWAAGLAFKVAGALIHLLLVIAVIVVLVKLFMGRKA
ncbi:lmo0937 family membrane protein [Devosia sp. PTR5]|uniref:Lmo0937 family membrane protein n=1 Tax=Devosia oryzisoli TaxID=2774138 RepID=A0A927FPN0_9HYPH|nr:lmo0937 family membrane protein [Devosia oryzisoli]MBD8063950.1 lmo0937 family membrane protein [Devosia oryzisoli]